MGIKKAFMQCSYSQHAQEWLMFYLFLFLKTAVLFFDNLFGIQAIGLINYSLLLLNYHIQMDSVDSKKIKQKSLLDEKISMEQYLRILLKQIKQNPILTSLISEQVFEYIQHKISKQHWPEENKRELIAILEELVKKTLSELGHPTIKFILQEGRYFKQKNMEGKQFGQAVMNLLNKITVRNKWLIQGLDLQKQFSKLQFDLSDNSQEPLQFAKKVQSQCNKQMLLIVYLSAYLMKCCQKMEKQSISIEEITRRLKSKATLLKNYFSVKSGEEIMAIYMKMGTKKAEQSLRGQIEKKASKHSPLMFKLEGTSEKKEKQLEAQIMEIVESAKNNHKLFDQIVQRPCTKNNGFAFKSNLKLSSLENKMPLARVKEKLLSKFVEESIKDLKKNAKVCNKINEQFQMEDELIKKVMLGVYDKIEKVPFTVTDMLRGKCLFNNISEINAAAKGIMERIEQEKAKGNDVELDEIDNRLGLDKITQDLVFKIRIDNLICEFQMAISFSEAQNSIHHKMYEIDRSKTFSPLYVLNEWNKKAVKEYFEMVSRCIDDHSFDSEQQKKKRISQKEDLAKMVEYTQNQKQKSTEEGYKYSKIDFSQVKVVNKDQEKKLINTMFFWLQVQQLKRGEKMFEDQKKSKDKFKKWNAILQIAGMIKNNMGKLVQAKELYSQLIKLIQKQNSTKSIEFANAAHSLGQIYNDLGQLQKALLYYNRALEIKKSIKGEKTMECASTIHNIGLVYQGQGKLQKALQYYNQALDIKKSIKGEKSIECASTLGNIGNVYQEQGNLQKALQYHNRALDILKAIKGEKSIDCVLTLDNIGNVYQAQGNLQKALQYYNRALDIKKTIKGEKSIDCASTLSNIGNTYKQQGKLQKALQYHNQALNIKKVVKGEKSIDCASTLNNIGLVYQAQGNLQKALQYYNRTLDIKKAINGEKSIDYALIINNIGLVYQEQGKLQKAIQYYNQALEIKKAIKGEKSIDCAWTLNNIGLAYQKQGKHQKALQYLTRALDIKKDIKGEKSIDFALALDNMANVYKAQGKHQKALQHYNRALDIKKAIKGQKSIDCVSTLNNIGSVYQDQGKQQKALQYYNLALGINKDIKGENSIGCAWIINNIGNVYKAQGNLQKALQYYNRTLDIKKAVNGEKSIDYALTLENIGNVYKAQGKLQKALQCYKKVLGIYQTVKGKQSTQYCNVAKLISNTNALKDNKKTGK